MNNDNIESPLGGIQFRIEQLTPETGPYEVSTLLNDIANMKLSPIQTDRMMKEIKRRTNINLGTLKQQQFFNSDSDKTDPTMKLAQDVLQIHYNGGEHLIYTADTFWAYDGKCWRHVPPYQIRNKIVNTMQEVTEAEFKNNYTMNGAYDLMAAMQAVEGDPLNFKGQRKSIINCQNGELWISKNGEVELREGGLREVGLLPG